MEGVENAVMEENENLVVNGEGTEENIPTREEEILFTPKQAEVVLKSVEERRFFQSKVQEALKKEAEVVSLVIDSAGIDETKIKGAKLNDKGTGLLVAIIIE